MPAVAALAAAAVALAILALAKRTPPVQPLPSRAEYLAEWRVLHGLEPERMRGGVVDGWLAVPYLLARPLARAGVPADLVTPAGLLIALAAVPAYAGGAAAAGGALTLLAGVADQVDGAVAVLQRRPTVFGAIWDSAVDRLSDLALLAGPAVWLASGLDGTARTAGLVGIAAAAAALFLLEYVRARCQAAGYTDGQVVTPAERPTRIVLGGLLGIGSGLTAAVATERAGALVWAWAGWGLTALGLVGVTMLLADAARRAGRATPTSSASASPARSRTAGPRRERRRPAGR